MTSLSVKQLFKVSFCTFGLIASTNKAIAQVTPDNTVNTQVTQNGSVAEITGGETRGSNLFHSFQDFSVGIGNQAFFNNATDIGNIFSRVTGGNISNINGAIRANGAANLFLINPAGIIFGEGASLNIGGSFYGSSASSILFEDGEFSAADLENPPLLTVNAPIGLNFRDDPGRVAVQGTNLRVESGQTLSLIGGEVSIENGNLNALGSTVNLGAVSAAATVTIDENSNLDFTNLPLADISLNNARVNVNGNGGGAISVNARNLTLSQASSLNAGIDSADSTAQTQGGDITINAAQNLSLQSGSTITNNIRINSSGNTGDIQVTANNLAIADESRLSIISQGNGNTGDINVNVAEDISLNRTGQIKSQILENGVGEGGDININSTSLTLTDLTSTQRSAVFTDLFGRGNAGDLNITVSDRIRLEGSNFQTSIASDAVGNAGNINIATNSLQLVSDVQGKPSRLLAVTLGEGNGGNINVNATDISLEDGSNFTTQVQQGAMGDAGNIEINTGNLSLLGTPDNITSLIANTLGNGDAGDITINATGDITTKGSSSILTQVEQGAEGNGGNVNIAANSFDVSQFQLIANTRSQGDAGSIIINVAENIKLDRGSLIASQVRSESMEVEGVGEAGDINITTGSLELNNSLIIADSSGLGSSGDINITAEDTITLQGLPTVEAEIDVEISEGQLPPSQIITGLDDFIDPDTGVVESSGRGEAGNINITARQLNLTDLASISSNVEANTVGGGGEVVLDADSISLDSNAAVGTFTANDSDAGSITVNSENLDLASGGRLVSATDGAGDAGTINLSVSDRLTIDNAGAENAPTLDFNNAITNELLGRTGLFANATERSTGNAGSILIGQNPNSSPQDITLGNGAEVIVTNDAQGNAGNIAIATDSLSLSNAVISAENAAGEGGNIEITASDRITLRDNSKISSAATNLADGGNITIDTNFIVAFPSNNDILASAQQGSGGNIKITAESLFGIQERDGNDLRMNSTNDINASSEVTGLDGTVNIETPDLNPAEEASQLPNSVTVPQEVAAQACNANAARVEKNSLIVKGKGGIPRSPELPMDSENLIVKGEMIDVASADLESQSITTSYGEITPARGVMVTKDGNVILTAYRTDISDRIPHSSRNCQ